MSDYYPSDREILAAKASEVMAEAIRASEGFGLTGESLNYHFSKDRLTLTHFKGKERLGLLFVDLDHPKASRGLDRMLFSVKRLVQERSE